MKNRIRFISHKDKRILLVDCSNCSVEELEELAPLVPARVTAEPRGSVLLLADFTGAKFDKKLVETIKPGLVFDRPHLKRSEIFSERVQCVKVTGGVHETLRAMPLFQHGRIIARTLQRSSH